jgi:hypothetical protein
MCERPSIGCWSVWGTANRQLSPLELDFLSNHRGGISTVAGLAPVTKPFALTSTCSPATSALSTSLSEPS